MLRTAVLGLAAILLVVAANASAATVNYSDINLHNGFIVVRDDIVATVDGHSSKEPGIIALADPIGHNFQDKAVIDTGGSTIFFNNCCILAGSVHKVRFSLLGTVTDFEIRPKLCNVRGIPFGFGAITITGTAERRSIGKWVVRVTPHVTMPACPPS